MKKQSGERAKDYVGTPSTAMKSYGSSSGKSEKKGMGVSSKGVGGDLSGSSAKEEAVMHESSFRTSGKDKNYEKKVESGTPRQDASYQNRDRQGSGLEAQATYQQKLKSYPKGNPKGTRASMDEDD